MPPLDGVLALTGDASVFIDAVGAGSEVVSRLRTFRFAFAYLEFLSTLAVRLYPRLLPSTKCFVFWVTFGACFVESDDAC
jgi:hypothetical protein